LILHFILVIVGSMIGGLSAWLHYVAPLFGPIDRPVPKGEFWPLMISIMAALTLSGLLGYLAWILTARPFFDRKRIEAWIHYGRYQVPVLRDFFLKFLATLY